MEKTNQKESDRREDCIHEGDDRLSSEDEAKSGTHFIGDDSPFLIEKRKISRLYLREEFLYALSIDDEEIREDERYEEFREYDPSIGRIGDCTFSDRFERICIEVFTDDVIESEIESGT